MDVFEVENEGQIVTFSVESSADETFDFNADILTCPLIRFAADLGVPFYYTPNGPGGIAYMQASLTWVTFVITICISAVNNLVRACIGGVK